MSKTSLPLKDDILTNMICGTASNRNKALHYIFAESGWRQDAIHILQKNGTPLSDAKDAIQEALIILDRQVRNGNYKKEESMKHYFLGICKKSVFAAKRRLQRVDYEAEFPILVSHNTPEMDFLKEEKKT